jgi:hypothetical protein
MAEWFGFSVAILATWRLCHLVAHEDGPFGSVAVLRLKAGSSQLGRLMDCPYCLSLWFAAPFAIFLGKGAAGIVFLWLGISGGACLIEHVAAALRPYAWGPVADVPSIHDPAPLDDKGAS